jgi:hypothetical protein
MKAGYSQFMTDIGDLREDEVRAQQQVIVEAPVDKMFVARATRANSTRVWANKASGADRWAAVS